MDNLSLFFERKVLHPYTLERIKTSRYFSYIDKRKLKLNTCILILPSAFLTFASKSWWSLPAIKPISHLIYIMQGSAFFRLFRLSGFLELNWTILEISANLMRKSYDPPPQPLYPPLVVPKASEYVVLKKVFQNFLGEAPSYKVFTFMHVALLTLFFLFSRSLYALFRLFGPRPGRPLEPCTVIYKSPAATVYICVRY